ncbi:MAG: hypothetical protein C5B59_11090 [Bacteroidetes bacterium]|nr:MAG: hypothetical protein C5B59_11090 [Bacteroidota bacterium]
MNTDIITEIANIALTLSFLIALVFGVAQVNAARRDRRERLTLETLREFQTREFVELMNYILRHDLPVNQEGLRAIPDEEQVKVIQFGQVMESLGILVAERLINLDLVDKSLGLFVTASWEKYKPLFHDVRARQPDPYLGEYFQWLAEEIQDRMDKNPRQPIHIEHPRAK